MNFKAIFGLLVALALGFSVGITLAIVGCAVHWNGEDRPQNWFALLTVMCYLLAPFPDVIARAFSSKIEREDPDEPTSWEHLGSFLTSFIATVGLGLLFVLAHVGIISWETFGMELSGGIVIVVTLLGCWIAYKFIKKREEENNFF
ncbi:hypothetical protein ABK040_003679 [Willaertia magna]